jgi:hypothetical protein
MTIEEGPMEAAAEAHPIPPSPFAHLQVPLGGFRACGKKNTPLIE